MPRTCSICRHPEREAIDSALVASKPFRYISVCFGTSVSSLFRHKQDHIPATLAKAVEASEVAHADNLLSEVRELQTRTLGILARAEASADLRTALSAIGQARGNLELLAKLVGELNERAQIQINNNNLNATFPSASQLPEWKSLEEWLNSTGEAKTKSQLPPFGEVVEGMLEADVVAEATKLN